jgi:hypothetical protein
MKIEVGESLLLSWLRHVKSCQLVQMNWKPSILSWELYNEVELKELMMKTIEYYEQRYEISLFKNSSFSQLLLQAEVDVFGISMNSEKESELFTIDVAFHEAGLNYGDKNETVFRVIKKLIRSAFLLIGFFNVKSGTNIFASPKVNNAVHDLLAPKVEELENFFNELGYEFSFKLYCNEDFRIHILEPVIAASESYTDTSEIFMRSIQLYNLFATTTPKSKVSPPITTGINRITVQDKTGFGELKVGICVRSTMRELLRRDQVTEKELKLLCTYEYSKQILDLNYPFLVEIDQTLHLEQQRYVNGRPRYWTEIFQTHNKKFYVCQEWFERNRSHFEHWIHKFNDQDIAAIEYIESRRDMSNNLLFEFHKDMINIFHKAKKETGYNATRYLQMLISPEASLNVAKKFVLSTHSSDGYAELWTKKRLDLTVEALVAYNQKYIELFTEEEINAARNRLQESDYTHTY